MLCDVKLARAGSPDQSSRVHAHRELTRARAGTLGLHSQCRRVPEKQLQPFFALGGAAIGGASLLINVGDGTPAYTQWWFNVPMVFCYVALVVLRDLLMSCERVEEKETKEKEMEKKILVSTL